MDGNLGMTPSERLMNALVGNTIEIRRDGGTDEIRIKITGINDYGGTCLVYNGIQIGNVGDYTIGQNVFVKEFCPYRFRNQAERNSDYSLKIPETVQDQFKKELINYQKSIQKHSTYLLNQDKYNKNRIERKKIDCIAPPCKDNGFLSADSLSYFVTYPKEPDKKILTAGELEHLSICDVIKIMRNAALALQLFENNQEIYLDLKPANILYSTDTFKIHLFDFDSIAQYGNRVTHPISSYFFSAPEAIVGEQDLSYACHTYSLGALFYFLLTGHPTYNELDENTTKLVRKKLVNDEIDFILRDNNSVLQNYAFKEDLKKLLIEMFCEEPKIRPALNEIISKIEDFERRIITCPPIPAEVIVGKDYVKEGRYEEAINLLENSSPKSFETYKHLGNCYINIGDYTAAENAFRCALEKCESMKDKMGVLYLLTALECSKTGTIKEKYDELVHDVSNQKSEIKETVLYLYLRGYFTNSKDDFTKAWTKECEKNPSERRYNLIFQCANQRLVLSEFENEEEEITLCKKTIDILLSGADDENVRNYIGFLFEHLSRLAYHTYHTFGGDSTTSSHEPSLQKAIDYARAALANFTPDSDNYFKEYLYLCRIKPSYTEKILSLSQLFEFCLDNDNLEEACEINIEILKIFPRYLVERGIPVFRIRYKWENRFDPLTNHLNRTLCKVWIKSKCEEHKYLLGKEYDKKLKKAIVQLINLAREKEKLMFKELEERSDDNN